MEYPNSQFRASIEQPKTIKPLRSFFSYGATGFVYKGQYWVALDPVVGLTFSQLRNGLNISGKLKFAATNFMRKEKKEIEIDLACQGQIVSIGKLDQWQGKKMVPKWGAFAPNR